MTRTPLTNSENDMVIRTAQDGVASSVRRFEVALEQLVEKVEDSAKQFQYVKDIANTPKEIAVAVKDKAAWVVDSVKKNPVSYLVAAASIFGAYWWLSSQKYHWEFPGDIEL